MVDTDLKVWLIEVNSSPSMDLSTVIVIWDKDNIACDRETCEIGAEWFSESNSGLSKS
jgi:hypothetical protein